jgi:hypothetical protein
MPEWEPQLLKRFADTVREFLDVIRFLITNIYFSYVSVSWFLTLSVIYS